MKCFFTTDFVNEENWNNFLLYISKLNGLFKKWKIYIRFEKNKVRYFIKTNHEIPTTLSNLGDFLIKKVENLEKIRVVNIFKMPYIMTNKEKTIIDVYDRNESKKNRILQEAEITILPYKKDNYLSSTKLIFKTKYNNISKKAIFNIPHIFLSIDFQNTLDLYIKRI